MIPWSWQVYNLSLTRTVFLNLIIPWAIALLSAVCGTVHDITMAPSLCRSLVVAVWDQVPWHPAGSYLEAFPQVAQTVLYLCCAVLWSPETRARLVSQDYVSPSLMSWKTPEYSTRKKFSRNDHTTATEGEFSLITAAKGALCQQRRQCKTAGSR